MNSEEQLALFYQEMGRLHDVIRQANRILISDAVLTGRVSPWPGLRTIIEATKTVLDYSFRVGMFPKMGFVNEESGVEEKQVMLGFEELDKLFFEVTFQNFMEDEARFLRTGEPLSLPGFEDEHEH